MTKQSSLQRLSLVAPSYNERAGSRFFYELFSRLMGLKLLADAADYRLHLPHSHRETHKQQLYSTDESASVRL